VGNFPTYEKIIKNVTEIVDILDVIIRVNLDNFNIRNLEKFLDHIEKLNLKEKINIYISFVKPNKTYKSQCLSEKVVHVTQLDIVKKILSRGFRYAFLIYEDYYCGAVYNNNLTIDTKGNIYKCPLQIYDEKEIVGNVKSGIIKSKNEKWIDFNIFENEMCTNCKVFPLCRGGCPKKLINDKKVDCSYLKYNLKKYLEIYFERSVNKDVYNS
jgi:uncharacterized protein